MAMCRDLGKDPAWLVDLFTDTSGATAALRNRSSIVAALLAGDESAPPTFDIDSMRKDLRTMLAEGASLGIDLPLVRRTLAIYEDAAAQGWGHKDGAAIAAYWSSVSAR
jgi:3-hydroxyisobutyrate dehydrogenase